MSETAQAKEKKTTKKEKELIVYNTETKNRPRKYEIEQDGLNYDFIPVFDVLDDERYLKWLNEFNIKGTGDDVSEEAREASCKLWDDIVPEVDNLEFDPDEDWKSLVPPSAKIQSLNDYL